jgi:hypothetical protein
MIPVPFLDAYLLREINRRMALNILREFEAQEALPHIAGFLAPSRGCLATLALFILAIPFLPFIFVYKLTTKLIKMFCVILRVRDVALTMGETLMLGHALEHCLEDGRIPLNAGNDDVGDNAKEIRKAAKKAGKIFKKTYKGSDFRLVGKIFKDFTLTILKSPKIVILAFKTFFSGRKDGGAGMPPPDDRDDTDTGAIAYFAAELTKLLEHHDMKLYVEEFDKRFDAGWEKSGGAPKATEKASHADHEERE